MTEDLRLIGIPEAHALTDIPHTTLYRMVRSGMIEGRQIGRRWRIRRASLVQWIETGNGTLGSAPLDDQVIRLDRHEARRRARIDGVRV